MELIEIGEKYNPDNLVVQSVKGVVLNRMERFEDSIPIFESLLEKDTSGDRHFHALLGLGESYFKTNRYHDSIASSTLAIQLQPARDEPYFHLGLSYIAIENLVDGVTNLAKAIEINPDHLGAHINLAHVMLKVGMFDEGWQHHEWRFHESMKNIARFNLPFPQWHNEPIAGKHIFLWVDQGLGDQVMYCSLIPRLVDAGARVTVMAERRLADIFKRSFEIENFFSFDKAGIEEIANSTGQYDYHSPMGSLPAFYLRSFDDFGSGKAFLKPNKTLVEQYTKELKERFPNKKLIGFGWRGGISATRDHARFIDLPLWSPLFSRPECQFINFQYDATPEEIAALDAQGVYTPAIDLRSDIDTVVAFLAALDLYITSDNTNAHLAGAIGIPIWNLIPRAAEWRWFLERDDSPWYQSMRLFRNSELDSWDGCMQKVNLALSDITDV